MKIYIYDRRDCFAQGCTARKWYGQYSNLGLSDLVPDFSSDTKSASHTSHGYVFLVCLHVCLWERVCDFTQGNLRTAIIGKVQIT